MTEDQKKKGKEGKCCNGDGGLCHLHPCTCNFYASSVLLSLFLKKWISSPTLLALIEGVIRIGIFFSYILLQFPAWKIFSVYICTMARSISVSTVLSMDCH